jgi:hypothetical protein
MTRKKVEANNTPLENYVVYNYNMRNTIQDEKIASKIPADTTREHDSFVGLNQQIYLLNRRTYGKFIG